VESSGPRDCRECFKPQRMRKRKTMLQTTENTEYTEEEPITNQVIAWSRCVALASE
jgi:hypothetical protein